MKTAGQFILCLMAASSMVASARADDLAVAANPYSSISERNIFALVPIPVASTEPVAPPMDPPPKITVDGIMNLFGKLEVLFKVAVKPPQGQPAKDLSLVLSEGERDHEITVTKIDEARRMITFINHDVVQEVPLSDPAKLTGPAPAVGGPGNSNPGMNTGGGGIPMPTASAALSGPAQAALLRARARAGTGDATSLATGGAASTVGGKTAEVSPEVSAIITEAQRAKWIKEKNPAVPIIPPTPITSLLQGEGGAATPPAP